MSFLRELKCQTIVNGIGKNELLALFSFTFDFRL